MDVNLADNQVSELDPQTSTEYVFESPPVESEPGDQPSSPFNEPLTFYSYPSPHHSLSLTTVKERLMERLGITS